MLFFRFNEEIHPFSDVYVYNTSKKVTVNLQLAITVPLNLNFTYAHAQKATAHNIHGNAPE